MPYPSETKREVASINAAEGYSRCRVSTPEDCMGLGSSYRTRKVGLSVAYFADRVSLAPFVTRACRQVDSGTELTSSKSTPITLRSASTYAARLV